MAKHVSKSTKKEHENQVTQAYKAHFSWKANLATNLPVFFAVGGIIYSLIVLFWPGDASYHDLYLYNKRPLVERVIQNRISQLQKKADSLRKYENPCPKTECDKVQAGILTKTKEAIVRSIAEEKGIHDFNTDTSLKFFSRYFSADRGIYLDALRHDVRQIPVAVRDTVVAQYSSAAFRMDTLQLAHERSNLGIRHYFDKYPMMGLWFFFSIAQFSMWLLILPILIGAVAKTNEIEPALPYGVRNAIYFSGIPVAIIAPLAYMFYLKFAKADGDLINDSFFLSDFNFRMGWYGIPGYIVLAICLGIYIFLGNKLEMLNNAAAEDNKDITTDEDLKAKFLALKRVFDLAFSCSAIILSVFILWMGILFNAVNGVEALHFYTILSGRAYLDGDFVYLAGMLHSLILLIFYVPVRLQFNALPITQDLKGNEDPNNNRLFKSFWDATSTVLITASPLIATVLQKLVAGLTGG